MIVLNYAIQETVLHVKNWFLNNVVVGKKLLSKFIVTNKKFLVKNFAISN